MVSRFIKFESGVLFGTLVGATVATITCCFVFEFFGYEAEKLPIIDKCIREELGTIQQNKPLKPEHKSTAELFKDRIKE